MQRKKTKSHIRVHVRPPFRDKLQTALLQQGMKVKINQFQSYSEQNKRMITKYVLTIPIESGNQIKNKTVLESYRLSEVVQKLAELLRGDGS